VQEQVVAVVVGIAGVAVVGIAVVVVAGIAVDFDFFFD
jgi:hypothetical protein